MDIWEIRAAELEEKQKARRLSHGPDDEFWDEFEKGQRAVIQHYRRESTTYEGGKVKKNRDGSIQEGLF